MKRTSSGDARLAKLEATADAIHLGRPTQVSDLMKAHATSVTPHDTAERAAQIMWEDRCGAVAVVDGLGAPIAMITDRDVCMAAYTQGKRLAEIGVGSAMSKDLHVARENQTIADAELLMRHFGIRRLPVVDAEGKLCGVLSLDDILAAGYPGEAILRDGLSATAMAATAAAVAHPHRD